LSLAGVPSVSVLFSGVVAMQRRSFLSVCLCSSLLGVLGGERKAIAKSKDENDPDGWIWHYTAKNGSEEKSGKFRVRNYKIFKDEKEVGRVNPVGGHGLGDKTILVLTDFGKLSGTAVLEKTHSKPAVWRGTLKAKDGTNWTFKVKLVTKD
jgi:hypothetical protein